jgi:hypothetical protein
LGEYAYADFGASMETTIRIRVPPETPDAE